MGASASVKFPSSADQRKVVQLPPSDVFNDLRIPAVSHEKESYDKIEWVMGELKKFPTGRTPAISKALRFLVQPTLDVDRKKVRKWVERVQQFDFVQWVMWIWPTFWEPDMLKGLDKSENDLETNIVWENFHNLFMIFWNGSDASTSFCISVVNGCSIEELIKLLDRDDFDPNHIDSEYREYVVEATTGVLHNCMRFYHEETKSRFRNADGLRVFREYMNCDNQELRTKAAMCLAFGINETEIEMINTKGDIIKYMVLDMLTPTLRTLSHRWNGFIAQEIIEALNALAVNDENKVKMVNNGVLVLYKKVLDAPQSDGELIAAVEGFWTLSFMTENAKKIKETPGCVKALEKLKDGKKFKLTKAATGALWNINGRAPSAKTTTRKSVIKVDSWKTPANEPASNSKTIGHVMISYDHQHKDVIRELNKEIQKAGYTTWLDADRMSGSTLEAMAEAIENASVVLVCMSDRYKNSPSCRTEAEYAYRLQKDIIPIRAEFKYKADGWLGILMGTKLYFDCYSADQIEECSDRVVKELGDRGKTSCPINSMDRVKVVPGTNKGNAPRGPRSADKAEKWDKAKVQKWFKDNELGHISQKFSDFDGKLLTEFKSMYKTSPAVFYQKAEKDLGLSGLTDLLKFTWNLERLK